MTQKNRLHALGLSAALLAVTTTATAAPTAEEKIELLSQEVEALRKEIAAKDYQGSAGRVHLGGYGELHYNNLDSGNEIDFHRFVLYFGYDFTDRIRFRSELELEHSLAGDDQPGEVELEQAFIEFDLTDNHLARGGLFLIPVGILNETHEPPTFYGVERNPVENQIIPTTWWEGGAALSGNLAPGLSYDFAVTSGLAVDPATFAIRGGRQKVAEALANDPMYTARLRWTGAPGVELATTLQYHQDITQSEAAESASAVLAEAHAILTRGPFGLRALYAQWNIDHPQAEALGRDKQEGWYIEPSYRITPKFGVFARYNEWDTEAGAGDATDTVRKQTNIGFNYWPHEQVVIKFDVQNQSGIVDDDGFNVGIGYMF